MFTTARHTATNNDNKTAMPQQHIKRSWTAKNIRKRVICLDGDGFDRREEKKIEEGCICLLVRVYVWMGLLLVCQYLYAQR